MTVLVFLAFLFSAFTAYRTFNLSPGEEVVTSGGITVAKPTNNIKDARLNDRGFLVVEYEDGTIHEVEPAQIRFADNAMSEYAFPEMEENNVWGY